MAKKAQPEDAGFENWDEHYRAKRSAGFYTSAAAVVSVISLSAAFNGYFNPGVAGLFVAAVFGAKATDEFAKSRHALTYVYLDNVERQLERIIARLDAPRT